MKIKFLLIVLIGLLFSCEHKSESRTEKTNALDKSEIPFDQEKWLTKEGRDYPYRKAMLNNVVYNDSIRSLNKEEILDLLGDPSFDREHDDYLYYMISQKRLLFWPLHTETMVIKFNEHRNVEWIKVHK